ncbi:tetratricopeptide repeat protein [Synechocystis sp. PCC 7509]|uniref:tetratricopeptide repeat protein n=1 Tax=Synechocystis sp. PCC 7509 TaxID=927677 RepID=UPI0002ABDAA1|nr:tetratricopeptide repeat protein [Synechocystis sp. PCC 7509]
MRSPIIITSILLIGLTAIVPTINPSPAQAQTALNSTALAKQFYNQGLKQFRNGQYPEALQTYQQLLSIESENGNNAGVGRTLNSLGGLYYEQDQYYQALDVYLGSLAIRRQMGNKLGEARTLYNLGLVYQELRQNTKAQKSFTQAMTIFNQMKDVNGIKATTEALSPTRPRLESGFSSGTILLDEYETEGLISPAGVISNNNPKIPTPLPLPRSIPNGRPTTPAQTDGLGPI